MTLETWSEPGFAKIAERVASKAGLRVAADSYINLERAVRSLMVAAGISEVDELAHRIGIDSSCFDQLIEELVVGESYFFRSPAQFDLIESLLLPALLAARSGAHRLQLWSAGCASGEEAYSLAILLDVVGQLGRARIVGTDISQRALTRARAARYADGSLRGMAKERIRRYFGPEQPERLLCDSIRESVQFHRLNLASESNPPALADAGSFDLILCRNVLLYLEPEAIRRAEHTLFAALAPGGYLIASPADPLLGHHAGFEVIRTKHGFCYQRPIPLGSMLEGSPRLEVAPFTQSTIPERMRDRGGASIAVRNAYHWSDERPAEQGLPLEDETCAEGVAREATRTLEPMRGDHR